MQSYEDLRAKLRTRGFKERVDEKVICRFFNGDLVLDVMPDDEKLLGFSNRWYKPGMKCRIQFTIDGKSIHAFNPIHTSKWIQKTLNSWLSGPYFSQAIEGHISDRQSSAGRRQIILERMKRATLQK